MLDSILTPTPSYFASNQRILGLTATFFTVFVVCEVVGAIAGRSLSLLGDAGEVGDALVLTDEPGPGRRRVNLELLVAAP